MSSSLLASVGASLVCGSVLATFTAAPPARRVHVTSRPSAAPSRPEPGRLRRRVLITVGVLIVVLLLGPIFTAIVATTGFGVQRWRPIAHERSRRRRIERELPDSIDMFVLLLHAGVSSRAAIDVLSRQGPRSTRPAFAGVAARLQRGEVFADASSDLVDELGSGAVMLVDLVGSAERTGVPIGPVLQQLAAETRATRRRLDEAAARRLPVALSFPLVFCTLPSFVLLAIAPAVMAALSSLGSDAW